MHWLDWVHVPASEWVVRSKISIALLVPVMVALAVAVRIARSPACTNALPVVSPNRTTGRVGRSFETGTLGVTCGGANESPLVATLVEATADRRASVHAAGLLGAGLSLAA